MTQYILFSKKELETMLAGGEIPFNYDGKSVTFRMTESLFEKVPIKQTDDEEFLRRIANGGDTYPSDVRVNNE